MNQETKKEKKNEECCYQGNCIVEMAKNAFYLCTCACLKGVSITLVIIKQIMNIALT